MRNLNFFFCDKFQCYELNNLPQIHWLRIDLDEIMEFLDVKELTVNSSILDITAQDLEKIHEMKEKLVFNLIHKYDLDDVGGIEYYQVQRWRIWFRSLELFEEKKKKFELDCVEELTKTSLIKFIFFKLNYGKWI